MLRILFGLRTVLTMLVLALALSGFAHRITSPAQQQARIYAATYGLQADDLCGDDASLGSDCQACRLHAGMILPDPPIDAIMVELDLDPADWATHPTQTAPLTLEAAHPARAPPLSLA